MLYVKKPPGFIPGGVFYIFRESMVNSSATAAYTCENQQSDDDEPYNLVTEKIAKAVHSSFPFVIYYFG